jgi:N,N-dimethylformamidase
LLSHLATLNGERPKNLIRAEIVYFETTAGGAVFSTGSITFCGSLSYNNYDNNISRMLENVLGRFASNSKDGWPSNSTDSEPTGKVS